MGAARNGYLAAVLVRTGSGGGDEKTDNPKRKCRP